MKANLRLVFLTVLLSPGVLWAVAPLQLDTVAEARLRRAEVAATPERLIAYLTQRAPTAADRQRVGRLIEQLGSDSFQERQTAARDLANAGVLALEALRQNSNHKDIEIRRAVAEILGEGERAVKADTDLGFPLSQAVVRVLAESRHPQAAQTLLRYLPFADCGETEEEIYYALETLHQHGQRAPLVAALRDEESARRAVAACILARCGDAKEQAQARQCVADKDARVRLRAVQGVLASKSPDKAVLPVLIELLREEAVEVTWQAEELLRFAVGRFPPREVVGANTKAERDRCWQAWKAWWKNRETFVDLTNLPRSKRRPGLVLGYQSLGDPYKPSGWQVVVVGWDSLPRYVQNVKKASSVLWVPSGGLRACIRENNKSSVVQYDLLGRVQWECPLPEEESWKRDISGAPGHGPVLELLPNQRTLVCDGLQLVVLDVLGQTCSVTRPKTWLQNAQVGADGNLYGLDSGWDRGISRPVQPQPDEVPNPKLRSWLRSVHLPGGAEQKRMELEGYLFSQYNLMTCPLTVLRSGEVFGTVYGPGYAPQVVEFDRSGKRARTFKQGGSASQRLRNGNTLVVHYDRLLEVTADSRVVWEKLSDVRFLVRLSDVSFWSARTVYPLLRFGFGTGRGDVNLDSWASRAQSLQSDDVVVRRWGARTLFQIDMKRAADLPEFTTCLRDPDRQVRDTVLCCWREAQKGAPPEAIPALITLLADDNEFNKSGIGARLPLLTPGVGVVKALLAVDQFQGGEPRKRTQQRANAYYALACHACFGDTAAIAAAKRGLADKERQVRIATLGGLSSQGPKARSFLEDVMRLAEADDPEVAKEAIGTVSWMKEYGHAITERFLKLLEKSDRRSSVIFALGWCAKGDSQVLPAILRYCDDKQDASTRAAALFVIGGWGGKKEVIDALISGLEDRRVPSGRSPTETVQSFAAQGLRNMGPSAKQAIPALRKIVENTRESDTFRSDAEDALRAVEAKESKE